jgi:twitching motility two-component system response regulator PilH
MTMMQAPFLATMLYELQVPLSWERWTTVSPLAGIDAAAMIMVINDDQSALDRIASRLQSDGYHVFAVANSHHALAQARILRPAAIVLDGGISEGEGWDILNELNHDPELAHTPVLLYSTTKQLQPGF